MSSPTRSRFQLAVLPLTISLAYGTIAFAADGGLEEIVVTAQKRAERLQDVPISISAISGSQLENRGIQNVADLSSLAPNLQVSSTPGNASTSQIAIRGSVTHNPALIFDTSVGVYLDGVYLGKSQGSVFDAVDLERVEVLRGPQGTLYGRNTIAGAINLITRKPSGEWTGSVTFDMGNYGAQVIKAGVDLPRLGIMSLSLGYRDEKRDGWVKTNSGSSVGQLNNKDSQNFRLVANFDISRDLKVDYKFDSTKMSQSSALNQLWRADSWLYQSSPMLQAYGLTQATADLIANGNVAQYASQERKTRASVDGPSYERMNVDGHALTVSYKLNDSNNLKWIASERTMRWADGLDLDGSPLPIAHTQRDSHYKQNSHELQWQGNTERLNYVLGYYTFKDEGFTRNPQQYFNREWDMTSNYGFTTKVDAWFGQLDYKLTDAWTLTGGLRTTEEKKTVDRLQIFGMPAFGMSIVKVPAGTHAAKTFQSTTPMLSLGYKVNTNLNFYGKYSEGYKSGGFNGESDNVVDVTTAYKPEKVKSLEGGMKSTFADGKAQVNVALFQNKVTDLQIPVFVATTGSGSIVQNVGKSTIQGLEFEGMFAPMDGLRLQLGYGYLDAKYKRFMDNGVDQKDNRAFVHAPKHSFNLMADARLAKTSVGTLRGIVDYAYTSSFYLYPYQLATPGSTNYNPGYADAAATKIGASGLWNMRLLLSGIPLGHKGDKAEASLWVRNLTDNKKVNNMIDFGPGFGSLSQAYFTQPRTYGVSLSYKW
ncbi:TonB-dependent receptor [Denitratisoma oestradiolicum]|nr:TonB-dependent receptor [Denitratisoma oestradiolicum]